MFLFCYYWLLFLKKITSYYEVCTTSFPLSLRNYLGEHICLTHNHFPRSLLIVHHRDESYELFKLLIWICSGTKLCNHLCDPHHMQLLAKARCWPYQISIYSGISFRHVRKGEVVQNKKVRSELYPLLAIFPFPCSLMYKTKELISSDSFGVQVIPDRLQLHINICSVQRSQNLKDSQKKRSRN